MRLSINLSFLIRAFRVLLLIYLLCIFPLAAFLRHYLQQLPPITAFQRLTPSLVTQVWDIHNNLISEFFVEWRMWLSLSDIPQELQKAVITIEDNDFYKHWGIDLKGVIRAFIKNLLALKIVEGGSTITQQLSKVAFLTQEKTFSRKIKELLLALQLEIYFSKDEILEMYLNQIYFGRGAYGVGKAARVYFGKHPSELNLAESALLAGLLRAPSYYSPERNIRRSYGRRKVVLRRMRELGFITAEEEDESNHYPLWRRKDSAGAPVGAYFVEYIRRVLERKYGTEKLYRGGLQVYTTLDLEMEKAAEDILKKHLESFDQLKFQEWKKEEISRGRVLKENAEVIFSSEVPRVQGALLTIDVQRGEIRTMFGGRDFRESQFNRTYQSRRQPGSAFKPIIFTTALDNGYTLANLLEDTPLLYVNQGRKWELTARTTDLTMVDPELVPDNPEMVWIPRNYEDTYFGKVTLRVALEKSLNSCAVQLVDNLTPQVVIRYARQMGIISSLTPTSSLALGSSDVSLWEMIETFSCFANQGIKVKPYGIRRVEDNVGNILEENFPVEEAVLSPQLSYLMVSLLHGVVERGTGQAVKWILPRPAAGKTGTTNEYSDAWFIGFTPQLVCGVWIGYDDHRKLGERISGGRIAAPIWGEFMRQASADFPILDFPVPPDIIFLRIEPTTGLLALSDTPGAYLEAFIKGTEPQDYYLDTTLQEKK